jgi:hypothetical protein
MKILVYLQQRYYPYVPRFTIASLSELYYACTLEYWRILGDLNDSIFMQYLQL